MRNIILVLTNAPPRILRTASCKKEILLFSREKSGEPVRRLSVDIRFVTLREGKCGVLLIASDRNVSLSEALDLHYQLNRH